MFLLGFWFFLCMSFVFHNIVGVCLFTSHLFPQCFALPFERNKAGIFNVGYTLGI